MRTSAAAPNRCSDRRRSRLAAALWLLALLGGHAAAQVTPQPAPADALDPRQQALQGRTVREIQVVTLDAAGRSTPAAAALSDRVLRGLQTRVGQPLDLAKVSADVAALARDRRINVATFARADGDQVVVIIAILSEEQIFESVEFQGLRHFTRAEIDTLLGLHADRQVTSAEANAMRNVLLARYRRDGYAWCTVEQRQGPPLLDVNPDWPRLKLTFRIDEGPRVTVREVLFRGNLSFPGDPPFGFLNTGDHLTRAAHMQSRGSWGLARGTAYSPEIVDEDLDRLRLFYRSRGFLDAVVELGEVRASADHTEVDLEFVVHEGIRYRIAAVTVLPVDAADKPLPPGASLYPPAEVGRELQVVPGEFYDRDRIRRDLQRLRDFYGKRGHPTAYGSQPLPHSFRIGNRGWPLESYTDDGRVSLTFLLDEGTPKTLRDVVIRGNTSTRDQVIRRKVFALPGERLDATEVEKSVRALNQLGYFQDPVTLAGPRVELLPVDGEPDLVDLQVEVQEGLTSELRWGIGISTGAGASANIEFKKRNFDLWNPPSSLNPVTILDEIIDQRAFHGGGQTLDLLLAPGTEITQFLVSFADPDVFGQHFDTVEGRVNGRRVIRRWREGYTTDTLGIDLGLSRNFSETFAAGISVRESTVETSNLAADAPAIAFDARGNTELRGTRLTLRWHDLDFAPKPTEGGELTLAGELLGGALGGEESLYKVTATGHWYLPLYENDAGHRTVAHAEVAFGSARAFGDSDDVFLTERFYMGGANLRGFDFRGAGPSQFGRSIGGEAVLTSTLELIFPLVATRMERDLQDRELIRGLLFTDFGLLGLSLHDKTFAEPRLSVGFGIRIEVPVLNIPIALDLGWPLLYEESDSRQQLYFSITR